MQPGFQGRARNNASVWVNKGVEKNVDLGEICISVEDITDIDSTDKDLKSKHKVWSLLAQAEDDTSMLSSSYEGTTREEARLP